MRERQPLWQTQPVGGPLAQSAPLGALQPVAPPQMPDMMQGMPTYRNDFSWRTGPEGTPAPLPQEFAPVSPAPQGPPQAAPQAPGNAEATGWPTGALGALSSPQETPWSAQPMAQMAPQEQGGRPSWIRRY